MSWFVPDVLKDYWKKFVDYIDGLLKGFWDYLEKIVNTIKDWFWGIVNYCLKMAWDFCFYLYDLFLGEEGFVWYLVGEFNKFVFWIGDWFFSSFPELAGQVEQYSGAFSSSLQWIGMLDQFFPLTECVTLFSVYMGFMFIVLAVRLCLKIIPGLGG